MILSKEEILELQKKNPPLIENVIDINKQLTPNGIDLSINEIHEFKDFGQVDFDNKERKIPETIKIEWNNDWIFLKQGCYKVKTNEKINMPLDLVAILRPRTTLLRSGASVATGLIDAGFHGKLEFMLYVMNRNGLKIKRNARVAQLTFMKMSKKVKEGYKGIYLGKE
jgi:dUTP pyrophosphatase